MGIQRGGNRVIMLWQRSIQLALGILSTILPTIGWAQESSIDTPTKHVDTPNTSVDAPPPTNAFPSPSVPTVTISPESIGQIVVIKTPDGTIEGKLILVNEDTVVLERNDGRSVTLERVTVQSLRVRRVKAGAAFDKPQYVYRRGLRYPPSPWGYWCGISLGVGWNHVDQPLGQFSIDLGGSFHFVYVGAGFGFDGTARAYGEAGFTKGIFIPYSSTQAIEFRPSVSYGLTNPASQYVRFQLGIFYSTVRDFGVYRLLMSRTTSIIGFTASFQQVVYGQDPRWNQGLMFGFVLGQSP